MRKLTARQKKALQVLTEEYQEAVKIMEKMQDCYGDRVLLQLCNRDLVERTDMNRTGSTRTWLGYRLTSEGKRIKEGL